MGGRDYFYHNLANTIVSFRSEITFDKTKRAEAFHHRYGILGQHHICQPLDPTLKICSNVVIHLDPPFFAFYIKDETLFVCLFSFISKMQIPLSYPMPTFSKNSFKLFSIGVNPVIVVKKGVRDHKAGPIMASL